ncbi:unnamed protein product [Prunus brigantina]
MDFFSSSECKRSNSEIDLLKFYWPKPTETKTEEEKAKLLTFEELCTASDFLSGPPPPPGECAFCLKVDEHYTGGCTYSTESFEPIFNTYKDSVPKGAPVGKYCVVLCKVCGDIFEGFCCGKDEGRAIFDPFA